MITRMRKKRPELSRKNGKMSSFASKKNKCKNSSVSYGKKLSKSATEKSQPS